MTERINTLISTLRLLAANHIVQVEYLKALGLGDTVDELALEYDAIATAAYDMLSHQELTQKQFDAIKQLDDFLSKISGPTNAKL